MSRDKYGTTLANVPEFASGEQPSRLKLNQSFSVIQNALTELENAVSDIHDENTTNSGLSSKELQIGSLGRMLGPSEMVQPHIPYDEEFAFQVELESGRNIWTIPFRAYDLTNTVQILMTSLNATDRIGSDVFVTDVGAGGTLDNPGDWKYDPNLSQIQSFSVIQGGTGTCYGTSHLRANQGPGIKNFFNPGHASWNVMPPMSETPATSVTAVASTSGLYSNIVHLHKENFQYVGPVQSSSIDFSSSANMSTAADAWEKDFLGVNPIATIDSLVQQKLPVTIASYSDGDEIPRQFVMVWDDTNSTMLNNARYYYRDQTSFYIANQILDTSGSTKYRVITNGANVTELVQSLQHTLKYHRHDGPEAISHEHLIECGWMGTSHNDIDGVEGYGWHRPTVKSFKGNPHPQYLMRNGYDFGLDDANLNNLMLGPLAFGVIGTNASLQSAADAYDTASKGLDSWYLDFSGQAEIGLDDSALKLATPKAKAMKVEVGSLNSVVLGNEYNYAEMVGQSLDIANNTASTEAINTIQRLNGIFSTSEMSGTDLSYMSVGSYTNGISTDCKTVYHELIGSNAESTSYNCNNAKFSQVGANNFGSIENADNLRVNITGSASGAVSVLNIDNADISVVHENAGALLCNSVTVGTDKDIIYRKARNIWMDSDNRSIYRTLTPDRFMKIDVTGQELVYSEDGAAIGAGNGISDYIPMKTSASPSAFDNFVTISDSNQVNLGAWFDLQDDSHVSEITLHMKYYDADLHVVYYGTDGTVTIATSTSLPTSAFSATSYTWTLDTGIGTIGERFPTLSGSAIDVGILIENKDFTTSNPVTVASCRYKYNVMRF